MTTFNIRPDDTGIRNLKNDNARPASTPQVDNVPPTPAAHPIKAGLVSPVERESLPRPHPPAVPPAQPQTPPEPRPQLLLEDRRQRKERREKQVPVILDTRARQQRRQVASNPGEGGEGEEGGALGIDTYT